MASVIEKTVGTVRGEMPAETERSADVSPATTRPLSQLEAAHVSLERNREALALLSKA